MLKIETQKKKKRNYMILSAIILNDLPLSLYRHIEIELRTKREEKSREH